MDPVHWHAVHSSMALRVVVKAKDQFSFGLVEMVADILTHATATVTPTRYSHYRFRAQHKEGK